MDALQVVLATGNAGKAKEFDRLLHPLIRVDSAPGLVVMPPETGHTFAANARLKAVSVGEQLGSAVAVLADDSGLEVAALDGRPGVLSARFAGEGASDEVNVAKLLGDLGDAEDRRASFVCSLCLALPSLLVEKAGIQFVEATGVLAGYITLEPRGKHGFGYDPVFVPEGWAATLAEADPIEKDHVSHRGAACRALLHRLGALRLVEGSEE